MARSENRLDEALEFLSEIEGRWARADDSYEVERARYWRGRVLEVQEKQADAVSRGERHRLDLMAAIRQETDAMRAKLSARYKQEF